MSVKEKQRSATPAPEGFPDPIETLADMMFGFVFDGPSNPKAPTLKKPPDEDGADDEDGNDDEAEEKRQPKRARDSEREREPRPVATKQHFSFDFGGLFGGASATPATGRVAKPKKGKASGKQEEEGEDDGDGADE
jgi:hypothetical protein